MMTGEQGKERSRFGALASRNYRVFLAGNAISLIGSWTHRIAAGWLAWEMTQSPTWLGLIAFADLFPTLLLGPFAGTVADRLRRLTVLKAAQVIALVPAILLVALSLAGLLNIWVLFGLTFALGSVQAMEQPARLAFISALVPREDLPSAVAINSVVFNLARFLGPALAGLIIALASAPFAFAVNALSFGAFLLALKRIDLIEEAGQGNRGGSIFVDVANGLRYIIRNPGLYIILALIAALNVGARPILELLPAFATVQFLSDSTGFAILGSAVGVGAMIGGAWLALYGPYYSNTTLALASSLGILGSAIAFILVSELWMGAVVIAILGLCLATSGIAMQSLIQLSTATDMRGRVLGVYGLLFRAAPALGGLTMGVLSEHFGLAIPVLLGALVIAPILVWAAVQQRMIRGMER